ncbi:MAG TPA: septal ring lytic transglycosylase RlpA family protein [Thermoanaerobaculia bacterium]|nr:septal ring lytic transglycosylase RlpA family protein [Thermoanaerobaculia bacterium]HUM29916.1 septal ring lytic transglycosylase RlpA family protein [Thermoanaerobaculia bacterium]HXK68217.1 septal ring lytic transglycosylase RlpA family protein [Thermoanaerobaculia bacterium]
MRNLSLLVLLALFLSVTGCKTGKESALYQKGTASWYGKSFHGLPTASGEIFDMHRLTAAHRNLPFGTWLDVYCPETGKRVTVKVNDRGPFIRGRIIDLSYAAAKELGMDALGIAEVYLYIRSGAMPSPPPPTEAEVSLPDPGLSFVVQAGAFKDLENASRLRDKISAFLPGAHLATFGEYTRVLVGSFDTLDRAREAASVLQEHNIQVIIREE